MRPELARQIDAARRALHHLVDSISASETDIHAKKVLIDYYECFLR